MVEINRELWLKDAVDAEKVGFSILFRRYSFVAVMFGIYDYCCKYFIAVLLKHCNAYCSNLNCNDV